jgi:hypothetical protein
MLYGSYEPGDCTFLLKVVSIATTDVAAKEKAIQTGAAHYSEMLSEEKSPTPEYMQLFHRALALNGDKLAAHVASLARTIAARGSKTPVVVSLARAGTPVGVLLHRALNYMGFNSTHYCVSIIRDRGVDWAALDYILSRHRDTDITFVDGWTGKGVISNELATSVAAYNGLRKSNIDGTLAVVADLAGAASVAVTSEDYLIPNAVLNSTVSGLISRTVLSAQYVGEGDFHACAYYGDKEPLDVSRFYVDALTPALYAAVNDPALSPECAWDAARRSALRAISDAFVADCMVRYDAHHRNYVKPGIGESTRALLRRVPDRLLLADPKAEDVQHLVALAESKRVPVEHVVDMPYRAAAIIMSVND